MPGKYQVAYESEAQFHKEGANEITRTCPTLGSRFSTPLIALDAGTGTARMGRTREKRANRIMVSLYIVKWRLCETGMIPGGVCGRMECGVRDEEGRDRLTLEKWQKQGLLLYWERVLT